MDTIKSKRFICWLISLTLFVIMSIFSKSDLITIATSITMLSSIYLALETFKPSQPYQTPVKKDVKKEDIG